MDSGSSHISNVIITVALKIQYKLEISDPQSPPHVMCVQRCRICHRHVYNETTYAIPPEPADALTSMPSPHFSAMFLGRSATRFPRSAAPRGYVALVKVAAVCFHSRNSLSWKEKTNKGLRGKGIMRNQYGMSGEWSGHLAVSQSWFNWKVTHNMRSKYSGRAQKWTRAQKYLRAPGSNAIYEN